MRHFHECVQQVCVRRRRKRFLQIDLSWTVWTRKDDLERTHTRCLFATHIRKIHSWKTVRYVSTLKAVEFSLALVYYTFTNFGQTNTMSEEKVAVGVTFNNNDWPSNTVARQTRGLVSVGEKLFIRQSRPLMSCEFTSFCGSTTLNPPPAVLALR